jgi:hypothetical protein
MAFQRGLLGIDLTRTDDAAKHVLGLRVEDEAGNEYRYVLAGGAITANAPVKVATAFSATVSGNAGRVDAVAPVAIASGDYGWVQTRGEVTVDAATDVDAGDYVTGISDASGRVIEAVAVAEGGAATHAVGSLRVIGVGLVNEAANVATIRLFGAF